MRTLVSNVFVPFYLSSSCVLTDDKGGGNFGTLGSASGTLGSERWVLFF